MAVWWPIWIGAHIRKVTNVIGINWHFCWQRQLRCWRLNGLLQVNNPLILRSGPPRAEMKQREGIVGRWSLSLMLCLANRGRQFVVLSAWHLAWRALKPFESSLTQMNVGPERTQGFQVWANEGYLKNPALSRFACCEAALQQWVE